MTNNQSDVKLKLFKPAETAAYLKMGIFGEAGSGKTWTAHNVAMGLYKYGKFKKPIVMFDTEGGSDYLKDTLEKEEIPYFVFKSRNIIDLKAAMKEAEKEASILIIDSISHVWGEFKSSFLERTGQKFIMLRDWDELKGNWNDQFNSDFLNSKLHIIQCGRQSSVFEEVEEEIRGRLTKRSVKTGTKMNSETQSGHEPSLLCQMEKVYEEGNGIYKHKCNIIKDRFDLINSKEFMNPNFKTFLPHIQRLNLGGTKTLINLEKKSKVLFSEDGRKWEKRKKDVEIILEKIKNHLLQYDLTFTSSKSKKCLIALLKEVFGTTSWTEVETMKLEDLETCLSEIEEMNLIKYREDFEKKEKLQTKKGA